MLLPSAPQVPTGLTGTTTITQANLSWDSVDGASQYNIYRDGTKVGESITNSYKDTGLIGSTTYKYKVSAVNGVGESTLSAEVSLTTQVSGS